MFYKQLIQIDTTSNYFYKYLLFDISCGLLNFVIVIGRNKVDCAQLLL